MRDGKRLREYGCEGIGVREGDGRDFEGVSGGMGDVDIVIGSV